MFQGVLRFPLRDAELELHRLQLLRQPRRLRASRLGVALGGGSARLGVGGGGGGVATLLLQRLRRLRLARPGSLELRLRVFQRVPRLGELRLQKPRRLAELPVLLRHLRARLRELRLERRDFSLVLFHLRRQSLRLGAPRRVGFRQLGSRRLQLRLALRERLRELAHLGVQTRRLRLGAHLQPELLLLGDAKLLLERGDGGGVLVRSRRPRVGGGEFLAQRQNLRAELLGGVPSLDAVFLLLLKTLQKGALLPRELLQTRNLRETVSFAREKPLVARREVRVQSRDVAQRPRDAFDLRRDEPQTPRGPTVAQLAHRFRVQGLAGDHRARGELLHLEIELGHLRGGARNLAPLAGVLEVPAGGARRPGPAALRGAGSPRPLNLRRRARDDAPGSVPGVLRAARLERADLGHKRVHVRLDARDDGVGDGARAARAALGAKLAQAKPPALEVRFEFGFQGRAQRRVLQARREQAVLRRVVRREGVPRERRRRRIHLEKTLEPRPSAVHAGRAVFVVVFVVFRAASADPVVRSGPPLALALAPRAERAVHGLGVRLRATLADAGVVHGGPGRRAVGGDDARRAAAAPRGGAAARGDARRRR